MRWPGHALGGGALTRARFSLDAHAQPTAMQLDVYRMMPVFDTSRCVATAKRALF